MNNPYSEVNASQNRAIEVLMNLGYIYLDSNEVNQMRRSMSSVILEDVLRAKLKELNKYEYRDKLYPFSDKNIEQAIKDLDVPLVDGLIKTNEKIYDLLLLGKSYEEVIPEEGVKRSFSLHYIDWENIKNNVFHVTKEFVVDRMNGKGTVRPDIVCFVNGIPFAVIECKNPHVSINQAISQMIRNQGTEYIPQLFKFVQAVLAMNKNEVKYGTSGTSAKFWSVWKEEKTPEYEAIVESVVPYRMPTVQDKAIVSLLHPKRLIELTQYFIVFDQNVKKIARYQQYFAIKEIIKTINQYDENGNRQSGVIWHTQGSGKSITMVMLARYILSEMRHVHPKIIVITDRINLDKQIHSTFLHTRLKPARATTGRDLSELLVNSGVDIITTTVHKFDLAAQSLDPITDPNIFALVDESHRTQYGELHHKMKKLLPNACYLGFTGTPLMKKEKNTMHKFGRLIHKYTIKDGVEDKAIVPLLYEGRMVEQSVNQKAIDKRLEMITRKLSDKQKEEVYKNWARFEKIASSSQRIKLIAYDINEHFVRNFKGTSFKAMLATSSKKEAIDYLYAFEELGDINCAVVISPPDQREGHEEVNKESKDYVQQFWNERVMPYGGEEQYEEIIKNEFVNGDELELLIVCDKLLTGFDAPRATVLYIDKPLKEHNLLQAIARVNRLYEGKDFGYIIDYRGLVKELDDALDVYSGAGLENFEGSDLKGAMVDVINVLGQLREAYTNLKNLFLNVKPDIQAYEVYLKDEALRQEFYKRLSIFGRYLRIAISSETVYFALSEDEIETYKKDFKFFQELRRSVKIIYSEKIDHKVYEAQMQKLMDQYIAAEDIIRVVEPVEITDTERFDQELETITSDRGKADAIRTRLTKQISKQWQENPAFYQKFSERIHEILEEYRQKRINDAEYLKQMLETRERFMKGDSGQQYPTVIQQNINAQAFYGVTKSILEPLIDIEGKDEVIAQFALEVDKIIQDNRKVDWYDNPDVHKRMQRELDNLLFKYKKEYFNDLTYRDFDRIIQENMKVALIRY